MTIAKKTLHSSFSRRSLLRGLASLGAASAASTPLFRAFAGNGAGAGAVGANSDEFFIFVHALGGWDVTLGVDARWEEKGLVNPASTINTATDGIRNWTSDGPTLADGGQSFKPIRPAGSPFTFGPGIGDFARHADKMTLFNGLAMNTVSHPDGQVYVATGRHLNGGRPNQSSIDVALASDLGPAQLLPVVSVLYPSFFIDPRLDPRASPLRIASIGTVAKSLTRSSLYLNDGERDQVTALLGEEARDLADRANDPRALDSMAMQYDALRNILAKNLKTDFSASALAAKHAEFNVASLKFQGPSAVNAAFALEAFGQNIARCVSFVFNGFDTHFSNYRSQALIQQEMFDTLAVLVDQLEKIPHPTRTGDMLADHTHILLTSDFCRTPQINLSGGRDHYPNGSAIVVSPRFKGNTVIGQSDGDQLLPTAVRTFSDGTRAVAPPDVLATFVSAFGVNPQNHFREGEIMSEALVGGQ
jgi:uncharacterized protein (DUF1501 family)